MYKTFFGLKDAPLGKNISKLWDNDRLKSLTQQFNWLLQSPGLGILTAAPGLGKTAALRQITSTLNPHTHSMFYIAETDFGRLDFYRQLAVLLNLPNSYRRAELWRNIKEHITYLVVQKNILPIFIIDEAHNLSADFFRDFPAFLNFVFDSKDYMTVWLVGHPELAREIDRPANSALASRIQARVELQPIMDRDAFKEFIMHGFEESGCKIKLLSDTGIDLIHMASQGNPRRAHQIIITALRIATDQKISHLPDEIINESIGILKSTRK